MNKTNVKTNVKTNIKGEIMVMGYVSIKQEYARRLRFLIEDISPAHPVLDKIYFSTDEEIKRYGEALKEMEEAILKGD